MRSTLNVTTASTNPATDACQDQPRELITLLQSLQKREGYLSQEGIRAIAEYLKISENQIFGVASFYTQFRFKKPGQNRIRVCQGTACHVQGGDPLSHTLQKMLAIRPGETTRDGKFELEEVACLGCCAQAPVVEINGKIYAKMTAETLEKIIRRYEHL